MRTNGRKHLIGQSTQRGVIGILTIRGACIQAYKPSVLTSEGLATLDQQINNNISKAFAEARTRMNEKAGDLPD